MLTDEQRARYERDGFLVLRGHLAPALVQRLATWAEELRAAPDAPGGVRKYGDDAARDRGESLLSRVEYVRPFHPELRDLFACRDLCEPVDRLFGEPAVLFKDKLNYKLPGTSGFALHQDVQAGWRAYARDFITVMIAIDPMTPENGCLELVAGAHREGLIGAQWQPLTAAELRERPTAPVPADAGDVVLFSGQTPHGSAANRTARARRALFLTYNPVSQGNHYERYFADKLASYPPDIAREQGRSYRYRV